MTFDEIRALDDHALRSRLTGDEPVERVWAIWALALRHADALHVGYVAGEPNPGVRRHLCVVLAGANLDLLVLVARHDLSAEVRTTASGLVARIAAGGALPWPVALARRRSSRVRYAAARSTLRPR